MPHLSRSSLIKLLRAWLALELGAGILALVLMVMFLPLAVLAYPIIWHEPYPTWALAVVLLAESVPLALVLGNSAARLVREVARP